MKNGICGKRLMASLFESKPTLAQPLVFGVSLTYDAIVSCTMSSVTLAISVHQNTGRLLLLLKLLSIPRTEGKLKKPFCLAEAHVQIRPPRLTTQL